MEGQNLELSRPTPPGKIPPKWEERFLIKRIDEKPIEITLSERNGILKALNAGDRFIQIGKYTLMLNSIKSIDPKWGANNIPPRPKPEFEIDGVTTYDSGSISNQKELDEWDKLFGMHVKELKEKSVYS